MSACRSLDSAVNTPRSSSITKIVKPAVAILSQEPTKAAWALSRRSIRILTNGCSRVVANNSCVDHLGSSPPVIISGSIRPGVSVATVIRIGVAVVSIRAAVIVGRRRRSCTDRQPCSTHAPPNTTPVSASPTSVIAAPSRMTIYVSHVDTVDASMDTPTRHCTISRDHHGGGRKTIHFSWV
jgi:hypothetical protein